MTARAGHANGPLPDFSRAGYHQGDADPPHPAVVADVSDYGARGDGEHDDTQAFRDALADVSRGAVRVPAGRYRITEPLRITRSRVVLRGAGADRTVLHCPTPLNEIDPRPTTTAHGRPTNAYSWSGGFLGMEGRYEDGAAATITEPARRGERAVRVASTRGLKPGGRVGIRMQDDPRQTLAEYLYSGDAGDMANFKEATALFVATVTDVTADRITLDRPLRFDVRPGWSPRVGPFRPSVVESGIESLALDFPVTPYEGHFTERGYNAITLRRVADCWVRDVAIHNADSGLFIGARFCIICGVEVTSRRPDWNGATGHHGVILGGTDNHVTRFRFHTTFVHDLCVSGGSSGNVFSGGAGVDMNFDHHRRAPYENLFTDIDVGRGSRLWHSGGGPALGRHCGARGTFWNIRAQEPLSKPPSDFGPASMICVGLGETVEPPNLYEAQRAHRRRCNDVSG